MPKFTYQVAMPQPNSHYFEVTLTVENWQLPQLNLKMPAWTPGSYLIREYVRHLQDFAAYQETPQKSLSYQKIAKNHWCIQTPNIDKIIVFYRIYAYDLSVRTNHLDHSHGYFNGAALFFFVPDFEKFPITLRIVPPQTDWQVATGLTALPTTHSLPTFIAPDFDTLVDCPVEIGPHTRYEFQVLDKLHHFVVWGKGNLNSDRLIADLQKIITVEANLFGGLPYDYYCFILHLASQGYGGLEHKNSCSLIYSRFGFREPEKYQNFLQLVAHEFFHLWNIKRIRPQALENFDYEQENYTPSLWFSEGTTSYYDLLIPLRAGIYDSNTFLKKLGQEITRFLLTSGRQVQPLAESSFDAWIKLYRRDANSDNSQMSYYLKGQLVTLLLDLIIRDRFQNQRSFDDVLRQMWEEFGRIEKGFTPTELETVIAEVAQQDLTEFFQRYLYHTEELPFNTYLAPFGLQLQAIFEEPSLPYLGIKVQSENNKELIKFVARHSPAEQAGLSPDDELLALNGLRVNAEHLFQRLKDYQADDIIQITVFHQDTLRTVTVQLAAPQPSRYEVVKIQNPSNDQRKKFVGWLESP
jgi:predicted metalloprotease with PDZ domain